MAVDHASAMLNAGRVLPGSRNLAPNQASFPPDQFFLRLATHICPVIFISLAGASIVLAARRRRARGESEAAIDGFLLSRGLFIALLDFFALNATSGWRSFNLDVLVAIGTGIMSMALLRRLPRGVLFFVGVALLVTPELGDIGLPKGLSNLLYDGGAASPKVFLDYPLLPWIGVMALGWWWGDLALTPGAGARRIAEYARRTLVPLIPVAFVLRWLNGFGNARAPRLDASFEQWLNLSKNPPSLAFVCLEAGLLGVLLMVLARLAERGAKLRPLVVFGQTALFFYVLHFYVLGFGARFTGLGGKLGIAGALAGAALVLVLLYPLCRRYAGYKMTHDNVVTRYV